MEFDFSLAQDIGTRSEQQDSAAVCPFARAHGALLVVADGLGGHTGGARASHIAVKTFADAGESGRFKTSQDRFEQLGLALSAANAEIATAAQGLAKNETMGTTLVAAAVAWNSLGWISVGDSHLYLWRAGVLSKLNEDHSQAGQMVKSGRYKPDDPELDAYRSMLRSAIMGREMTLIDRPIETMALERGDILVLATDGLNVVETAEVERMIAAGAAGPAEALANTLLDAVRASPATSRDNATVIVARVTALDGEAPLPGATTDDAAAGLDADAVVTTAIVTTPFYKTGRPGGRREHVDVAPQGIIATPPSAAIAAATGTKPARGQVGGRVAEETFVGEGPASTASPAPESAAAAGATASRKRGLWLWFLMLAILGGAALAFAYHRDLLPR